MLGAAVTLAACGGGSDWDKFRPRAASVSDLASQSFVFTGFSYGTVFDPSLASSTTTLSFGPAQASGNVWTMPFALAAKGSSAAGTATFDGAGLLLEFTQTSPALPFSTAVPLDFDVFADVDDGRISLTNRDTGVEQTSAPR